MTSEQAPGGRLAPIDRDWETQHRESAWDFLADLGEAPRNALVAGLIHRIVGTGAILDIGCGEAPLLDYLDLSRISYSGFDIARTAVERARLRGRGHPLDLFVGSMDDFAPAPSRFDLVLFNEALSHSRQPIQTLNRFRSALKSGGHVLLSQFQTFGPQSDGAYFTPMLDAELAEGRLMPVHTVEVTNLDNGIRWRIYVFPRE